MLYRHSNNDIVSGNTPKSKLHIMYNGGMIWKSIMRKTIELVKPDTTTKQVDEYVGKLFEQYNVKSAPLFFYKIECNACISVNDCLCHGLPTDTKLKHGDVVSIDISFIYNDYCIDGARTIIVINKDIDSDIVNETLLVQFNTRLLETTIHQANLLLSNGEVITYGTFGNIIEQLTHDTEYSVCEIYGGHKIGKHIHEKPFVSSVRNTNKQPILENDSFCVEPIISLKNNKDKYTPCVTNNDGVFHPNNLKCSHYENTYYMVNNRIVSLTSN